MDDVNEQTAWIIMGAMSAFGLLAFWVGWFAGRARLRASEDEAISAIEVAYRDWVRRHGGRRWRIEESNVQDEV